jgi:hypothetical protein
MGLMSFLKGLFGSRPIDIDDDMPALPPAPVPAFTPAPAPAPAPMPIQPPAPPPPPQFRLAERYPTTIDFPAVLRRAGVDVEQQQRVAKAQDLLRSLPENSPAALKRQIVEAAFTAFDVPTQKIIQAASAEVDALQAFIHEGGARAQQVIDEGTARIAELDAEIAEIRESMAAALADQAIRDAATEEQIAGVKPILSFFAQAQEPGLGDFMHSRDVPPPVFMREPSHPSFMKPRPAAAGPLPDFLTDIDVE